MILSINSTGITTSVFFSLKTSNASYLDDQPTFFFFQKNKRDIFHEKWGFMLIFWNMAGVPMTYCHCTIFLANHAPSTYRWSRTVLILFYLSYLLFYWIWDTTGSQKSRFKQMRHGGVVHRWTFPQLPWQTLTNPKTIKSEFGDLILVDGWCKSFI